MITRLTLGNGGKVRSLPVDWLERGALQPRSTIDGVALNRLAESIRSEGVIQPIFVRKKRRGRFEIIAGERRWHAAKIAGLRQIPSVISDVSDESALAIGLIENLHREDLNPIDQAVAMRRLIIEFGMTHQAVANVVGRSRAAVSNLIRLLELPRSVRDMVADGKLDMGHARALLALPEGKQEETAQYVVGRRLSVRDVEAMVKRVRPLGDQSAVPAPVEKGVAGKVSIRCQKGGHYQVGFSFKTHQELERAIDELQAFSRQLKPEFRI